MLFAVEPCHAFSTLFYLFSLGRIIYLTKIMKELIRVPHSRLVYYIAFTFKVFRF